MMSDFIAAMTYPFLACLLLAGIHVYLGIHVLARKVIFVDLALAQIAAFGAVYGVLLGYEMHDDAWAIKGFSLAFAILGAAVFSLTRMRHERIPHEAIIGITYAGALSATILASANLAHGADEVRDLLAGSILWVQGDVLIATAILYALVGLFHYLFRHKFLQLSLNPELAEQQGLSVRWWDFLFYLTFGFIVTSSVAIAGVLLVFSYLVIPAVIAMLLAQSLTGRLIVGWIVGALVSFLGVAISYAGDLPSGPTIVVSFALALVLVALVRFIWLAKSPLLQLGKVLAGLVALCLFLSATWAFRRKEEPHTLKELLQSTNKNERLVALTQVDGHREYDDLVKRLAHDPESEVRQQVARLIGSQGRASGLPMLYELLIDESDDVREEALRAVRHLNLPESAEPLAKAVQKEKDPYLKVEMAEALLELGDKRGIPVLIDMMDPGQMVQVRKDAYEHLSAHVKLDLPFSAEMASFRRFWQQNQNKLRWLPEARIFVVK